jgi:acetyl esterase/lipase
MRQTTTVRNTRAPARKGSSGLVAFWAFLSLTFGLLHFVRLRSPRTTRFFVARVMAAALSPVWAALGLISALAGLKARRPLTAAAGLAGFLASASYIRRVAAVTPPEPDDKGVPRSAPRVSRDVAFYTTTQPVTCGGGVRPVYCDVWQPADAVTRSGIAIVYLHGSAWYLGDKAQMTDPMLGAWASRGHVVMDVAYRMCPETDLRGMMADAWAAVDWLKAHAEEYGIDPHRVVLSGTSAGGHVALLSAYTPDRADMIPPELAGRDVTVAGVFTMSAPVDMPAMLEYHENMIDSAHPRPGTAYDPLVDLDPLVPPAPGATRRERTLWQQAQVRRLSGLLRDLLGGGPDDSPAMFEFATVKTHVRPGLPPTLLIQGDQDALVPVEPARELYRRLQAAGVRAEYLELPQTDHAFEIAVPQISPPARAASVAIRRFLAKM